MNVPEPENTVSWTIRHSAKKSSYMAGASAHKAQDSRFASDRENLHDEVSGNGYVAPSSALLDYLPQPQNLHQQVQK